jgi:hypothetical protein
MKYKCLSIVQPNGTRISNGLKTIEVRSWIPDLEPTQDLLIIENTKFLRNDGECDPHGKPVALVKVRKTRDYLQEDILAACASSWEPGYFSWELYDVRPVETKQVVLAARGIYELNIDLP